MSNSNHTHSSSPDPPRHRPTTTTHRAPPPSSKPNLTTTLYHTNIGIFALTWSRTLFGRSLHLHLLLHNTTTTDNDDEYSLSPPSLSSTTNPSFHLQIKPFIFWNKHGSKKLTTGSSSSPDPIHVHWDLAGAKFGSGPEPISGFYIAVLIAGKMTLLVGDSHKQAYSKTKATNPDKTQITVLRREHVYAMGNKKYSTNATFRGKTREISIDCRVAGEDSKLYFSVDNKRVLQVKHLKWKFRGNERIEIDGVHIQVSWDVYNWLFEEEREDDDGYALFMFRFEKSGFDYHEDDKYLAQLNGSDFGPGFGFGFERRKMKKGGLLRTARSSSSSSLSSSSSGCGSVLEWESVEENELKGPSGFSLLVYAWKS